MPGAAMRADRPRTAMWVLVALGISGAAFAATPRPAAATGPLVRLIDVDAREGHTNVIVQFSCSVQFLSNMPVSHGSNTRISLRLGQDCGALLGRLPPEFPPIGGGDEMVTSARLEATTPGVVVLELNWSREMDFVIAPTDGAGLRLRLVDAQAARKGTGLVYDVFDSEVYSVNLDASRVPFERAAVEAVAAAYGTQAYVSEADIDSEHWFRLRLGPFTTRRESERVLNSALGEFPRAWIAVGDEQTGMAAMERAGVAAADPVSADIALPDWQRSKLLAEAHAAMNQSRYADAVAALTPLVAQPEYPARAQAHELLGLVRERAGQLAQAKAEYQAYLLRYPDGAGAERVRRRMQALIAASIAPRTIEPGAPRDAGWSVVGSTAVGYQYERGQMQSDGVTTNTTADSAALVHGDLLVRDRGSRFDFTGRLDAAYTRIAGSTPTGGQDQTSAAYAELADRSSGLTGRVGRQTLASQGVIGLFDGLSTGYQINSRISVTAAAGYPVYTDYDGFHRTQRFESLGAEYSPTLAWLFDAYVFNETEGGFTDRRSFGVQARFSKPGYSAIALLDYDFYFRQLDSFTLIGNLRAGEFWIIGVNVDHRRIPLLELHNALIGQAATDLRTLEATVGAEQMKQLALDRTPTSDTLVLSATRALGERWQAMIDVGALRLGSTPSSAGVPGTPTTGVDKYAGVQMAGSNLLRANDLHIFGLRIDDSPNSSSTTISWDARFPVGGAWRFGPRLSAARAEDHVFGGRQTVYLPEVRSDWSSRRQIFEFIAGYQMQLQQVQTLSGVTDTDSIGQRTLYVSMTYRQRF